MVFVGTCCAREREQRTTDFKLSCASNQRLFVGGVVACCLLRNKKRHARLLPKKTTDTPSETGRLCSCRCNDVCLICISVVCMSLDGPHTGHKRARECGGGWRAAAEEEREVSRLFPTSLKLASSFFQEGKEWSQRKR